jgi:lipopolysaccharide/colanic/teichoic acid biosynthesis glycosyltransferase
VAFVYVFRIKWGAFPTSTFILSFFTSLLLVFKVNQLILKSGKRIRKKVVVIGEGYVEDVVAKHANVERKRVEQLGTLLTRKDVDEVVICERIQDEMVLNLLIYLMHTSKIDVVFAPSLYTKLLPDRINGDNSIDFLSTFVGKKRDIEELLIRGLDILGSVFVLLVSVPAALLISFFVKVSSAGPVLYKQQRAGKDGKVFTLYKFRTMVENAETLSGLSPAVENDPRVTRIGKWLRRTRLDEMPQLLNVIKGDMSLVGPRPENLYRVGIHKSLQGLRLAVKPGITGLAQIRSFYSLKPTHKIKYDYLYIQQRSFLLNLYILAKTVPVIFTQKGW